jgi:uncharacterized protein
MQMKGKISLVTLGVADVAASGRFYDALGFRRHEHDSEAIIFYVLDGAWLAIFSRSALAEDAGIQDTQRQGFSGVALAHNVPEPEGVDAALMEAGRAGARIVKPAADTFWGGRSGYFADPDNHLWEIAWNPFMDLT